MPYSNIINFTRPAAPLSEIELCGWIGQAAPGAALEYHRGFLALDTVAVASRLPNDQREELLRMSRRAMWAAEQGLVHLVQRRLAPDCFAYLAIARPKLRQERVSLSALMTQEAA
ncbi:hypothetical protein [Acuticoccus yangtzensis]|uniref:hypothetical protein n=1 Tax=Acuticoccus yangtzensis TaxID=1443441 RepID=UPI0009498F73|nr:hypothetical protein [Acuticoccus yangtzensis]